MLVASVAMHSLGAQVSNAGEQHGRDFTSTKVSSVRVALWIDCTANGSCEFQMLAPQMPMFHNDAVARWTVSVNCYTPTAQTPSRLRTVGSMCYATAARGKDSESA